MPLPSIGVAALAEQPSLLERRIRALLSKAPEVRMAQAALLGFCAILVVGVALLVPGIAREGAGPEEELEEDRSEPIVTEPTAEYLPPPPAEVETLPEPASEAPTEVSEKPAWTPRDVEPYYTNKEELQRALVREYPALLRDAGIGGTVVVWFFIDEAGEVQKAQLKTSSGHTALDEAAL